MIITVYVPVPNFAASILILSWAGHYTFLRFPSLSFNISPSAGPVVEARIGKDAGIASFDTGLTKHNVHVAGCGDLAC